MTGINTCSLIPETRIPVWLCCRLVQEPRTQHQAARPWLIQCHLPLRGLVMLGCNRSWASALDHVPDHTLALAVISGLLWTDPVIPGLFSEPRTVCSQQSRKNKKTTLSRPNRFFGNKKNQGGNKRYLSNQREAICHQDR